MIEHDEVKSFFCNFLKKLADRIIMIYHLNQNHVPNKIVFVFCRMKDKGIMAVFLKSCSQKLKKEGKKDDFEYLDASDKDEFHRMLQIWHHQK